MRLLKFFVDSIDAPGQSLLHRINAFFGLLVSIPDFFR